MFQTKSIIPIIFIVFLFVHSAVYPLNFKDILRTDIRACENNGALFLSRYLCTSNSNPSCFQNFLLICIFFLTLMPLVFHHSLFSARKKYQNQLADCFPFDRIE